MSLTPHYDKLNAAILNPKCQADKFLLEKVVEKYHNWVESGKNIESVGQQRVYQLVDLLNE